MLLEAVIQEHHRDRRGPAITGQQQSVVLQLGHVLCIADLFQPGHGRTVHPLLNRDVAHACRVSGTMPMLLPAIAVDHVASSNFLLGGRLGIESKAPELRAGSSGPKRVSIRTSPVKYSSGPFAEGREPTR